MKRLPLDDSEIIPRLAKSRIGKHLNSEELHLLVQSAELLEFEAGELVITEHAVDQDMYVIIRNSVIIEMSDNEVPVYVCTLGEGEIIGEAGLFINVQRTANVRAADDAQLLKLSRASFFGILKSHSPAAIKLMFMIIYGLLTRLRMANEELAYERRADSSQSDIDAMIAELIPAETAQMLSDLGKA